MKLKCLSNHRTVPWKTRRKKKERKNKTKKREKQTNKKTSLAANFTWQMRALQAIGTLPDIADENPNLAPAGVASANA